MELKRVSEYEWRIPKIGGMNTDGLIFASSKMMDLIKEDESLKQVANVAHLPGIVGASMAMPDIHWGYGFPIGGVAAFDAESGVVSPGGVGYDISCGVRVLRTELTADDLKGNIPKFVSELFDEIPTGIGSHRRDFKLSASDMKGVLENGAKWVVGKGYGTKADLDSIEDNGRYPGANPEEVSSRAKERGSSQLGTLGAGNHFVELGFVEEIFSDDAANVMGLFPNQVTVMIHTGSRGLGYQVCDDYIDLMLSASNKYKIKLPDKQLCSAPITSPEGKRYLSAMAAAANFAYANRQMITHYIRDVFEKILGESWEKIGMELIYDVSHNIAKFEEHMAGGNSKRVLVHRKGATRAFPPGHPALPSIYKDIGQPVLIPGDMGRYSYILVGTKKAMEKSFGSTCHGAGRLMSRKQAVKNGKGRDIERELRGKGIYVQGASRGTVAEEMPEAYKDVAEVVDVVHNVGLSKKVARIKPLGVIKG